MRLPFQLVKLESNGNKSVSMQSKYMRIQKSENIFIDKPEKHSNSIIHGDVCEKIKLTFETS